MIIYAAAIITSVILMVPFALYVKITNGTIRDQRECIARLYADNQRMTEALVRKDGGYVDLKPDPPANSAAIPPTKSRNWYAARQEEHITIGDKTITVRS